MELLRIDWRAVFAPSMSWGELVLRGSLMYLALFALMRFVLKREAGTVGLADLLMTVMVADAAQNGMAADYKSFTDGVVLVGTLVFWNYLFDWMSFRSTFVRRLVEPPPLKLVENGRVLRRNMRKELISEDELMSHVREEGIDTLAHVHAAYMESDGRISVIRKEPAL